MSLRKIKDLDIAKNKFSYSGSSLNEELDYSKWVEYIDNNDYFIWYENFFKGKYILENINTIPEEFRQSFLSSFNRIICLADYRKGEYLIRVTFPEKLNYIKITFMRTPTIEDLRRFMDMANYLDALLLHNGKKIIDEKFIESLI
jgi:hypothetical protein